MKAVIIILLAAGFVVYFSACDWDRAGQPNLVNIDTCVQPTGRLVTYVTDIKPILDTYCTNPNFGSCHQSYGDGGYPGLDYSTWDGINTEVQKGKILDRVLGPFATGAQMPSSASLVSLTLTPCDTNKIHIWINEGAPEQ